MQQSKQTDKNQQLDKDKNAGENSADQQQGKSQTGQQQGKAQTDQQQGKAQTDQQQGKTQTAQQQGGTQTGQQQNSSQAEQAMKKPSPENMSSAQDAQENDQMDDQVTGKQNVTNNDGASMNPTNAAGKGSMSDNKNDSRDSMGSGKRQDDN
jgi:hypothetical protein